MVVVVVGSSFRAVLAFLDLVASWGGLNRSLGKGILVSERRYVVSDLSCTMWNGGRGFRPHDTQGNVKGSLKFFTYSGLVPMD